MEELKAIQQKLVDAIMTHRRLTLEGKFRLAQRHVDIIEEITDQIKSGQVEKIILGQLCVHENMNVRHLAAMEMLRMNYETDKALAALISVSDSNSPIISLVAGWQIKSWKESGSIDAYHGGKESRVSKKKGRKDTLPTFEPALAKYEELNDKQRVAYLASIYDGDVNNGGHYQYFENKGIEQVQETINSLKIIGARKQSRILDESYKKYVSKKRLHPTMVEEFVEEERKGEFLKLDKAFYDTKPEIQDLVDRYLEENDL